MVLTGQPHPGRARHRAWGAQEKGLGLDARKPRAYNERWRA